jgi:hypothetical protein
MAENPWNNWTDLLSPLQENVTKVFQENVTKVFQENVTKVFQGIEKVASESDELKAFWGLGDGDPKKIYQPPAKKDQAPAPAKTAPAPAPAKTAPAQPPAQSQSLRRSASASSAPARADSTSTLGRSASASSAQAKGSSSASSAQAKGSSSTSTLGRSAPASTKAASTSSLNRADSDKAKVAQSLDRSSSTSSAASTLSRADSTSSTVSTSSSFSLFLKSRTTPPKTSNPADNPVKNVVNASSKKLFSKSLSLPNLFSSTEGAPSRVPSRAPSKDDLSKEGGGNKLPLLKKVSSGLSSFRSSLPSGTSFYLNYKLSKRGETIVEGKKELSLPSLPRAPSFNGVRSGFRRGVSGLGRSLSKTLSEASETIAETRNSSSSLGESFRDAKRTLGSLRGFSSEGVFPSSSPSPKSWRNPLSGMSGVSSIYKQDAKAVLRETGSFAREASSQAGEALGDWARSVRQRASGWSAMVSLTTR